MQKSERKSGSESVSPIALNVWLISTKRILLKWSLISLNEENIMLRHQIILILLLYSKQRNKTTYRAQRGPMDL